MGVLQHQQSSSVADPQQEQSESSPIPALRDKTTETMGWSYRTPSPTRQSLYSAFEHDATPTPSAIFDSLAVLTTPLSSPRLFPVEPATPHVTTQSSAETFGLLTPSTPNFSKFDLRLRLSTGTSYEKQQATTQALSSDGSIASPVANDTKPDGILVDYDRDTESGSLVHTRFDKLQKHIRGAEIAAQLTYEENTSGKRRSTRIAKKVTTKVEKKLAATTSKPVKQAIVTKVPVFENVSPPESIFKNEAVIHLPAELNPTLLSIDWQLQYPPGGSTHPSYAYPQMDPRLLFDPALVPIVDGLPTVLQVPPLVLPIGWRHISWSGFLPIAFDPYHQAFKLTPVGPLPLTCEEVQQGGLAKFVPGGECHPEVGMLPDISALSDGSDEVYNFENLDWVLPWPKGENFDSAIIAGAARLDFGTQPLLAGDVAPTHYIESRDCPDDVVDIEDAWRWLSEKAQNTITAFSPSPEKSWKGSGIYQTTRKVKQPISSLLASALSETLASPSNFIARYLIKQNGRDFCPFRSVVTPVHINITLLGDTEFTLKELLCYFPLHYVWRKASDRMLHAGMSASSIANMINMTRQLSGESSCKSSTISTALTYEAGSDENGLKVRIVRDNRDGEPETYTAEGWVYEAWELMDYPILGLAHGLVEILEGEDAGPLTHLIQWCKEQGKYDVMLSNVPDMLREAGIMTLVERSAEGSLDKKVLPRHAKLLAEDRKRVLNLAKEKTMFAEGEVTKKRKRVVQSEELARQRVKSESTIDCHVGPL